MLKFVLLALLLPLSAFAKVEVPIQITRVPFTGEHFMYNDQDEEKPLFKKLFDEGRLQFTKFVPLKKAEKSDLDFASKARIGHDVYRLSFASVDALHAFARDELKQITPYDFPHETVPYGLLTGIRDYAIKSKDIELIKILLEKARSPEYAGSANEHKADLYHPLEKALKQLQKN